MTLVAEEWSIFGNARAEGASKQNLEGYGEECTKVTQTQDKNGAFSNGDAV